MSDRSKMIFPNRFRFTIAFTIFYLMFLIPVTLVAQLILGGGFDVGLLIAIAISTLLISPLAYIEYALSKDEEKIVGSTIWGLRPRREEIRLEEINLEKISCQNLGRQLGILILYSYHGKKILTLGLTDSQISNLLESVKKQQQTSRLSVAESM